MAETPGGLAVLLTGSAERDLESIYDYIAARDGPDAAERVLDGLMQAIDGLETFPMRGACPQELLALGIKDFRQSSFKPYRLIYRVFQDRVVVYLIADGRRDMQSLLARRLLGA